ncbi:hypothetical protein E1A91_D13G160300v1 [Gossypium mustelinum]|uniref:Isopentenyl-diphosphate delta-isomerase n=2 Tax=Gossypium TaxID=3633 RepID=A0A5D2S4E1_GOSMU|nr:hypothetical protein ES288_D13G167000v1 [Gossypium darwinii]TYI47258.1 hypothetical protein E1A91_D13G160300v1 [Gossypium mustelinum]
MAGIAILLDLYRKNPSFCSQQSFHSSGFFSASAAAASAAATVVAGTPFASRFLFGNPKVSHCDAAAAFPEDYISNVQRLSEDIVKNVKNLKNDALKYAVKEYKVELKPLYSAFELRPFAMTTLRSFLMFYLPLLEPATNVEEDDEDFLQDTPKELHVDLVVPFKKSVKQIIRETTVVTTRRVLERLAVIYVSQRMAWKLLKDVPKSAVRKSQRGLPTTVYFFRVSRTTFRGHLLGVVAAALVQTGIEIYRCFCRKTNSEESDEVNLTEQTKLLGKKISGITIRCGASLIFASIGAGIGAVLFRPSVGQWIGCAAGDLAGPIIVSVCLEKAFHVNL